MENGGGLGEWGGATGSAAVPTAGILAVIAIRAEALFLFVLV